MVAVKNCPDLSAPSNGVKNSTITACGTVVAFSCNECYDLVGDQQLTCLSNSSWSGEVPSCNGYISALNI